jgi:hypothetical protein
MNPSLASTRGTRRWSVFQSSPAILLEVEEFDRRQRFCVLRCEQRKGVIILHSPTNFGGTGSRKTNKVACLMGLSTNATCVILDEEAIVSSKEFKGTEGSNILKCDTKDEIKALTKNKYLTLREIIFPAPFMRAAVMNLESKDPFEIILASNKPVVEAFEAGTSQDTEVLKLRELANDHVQDLAS